MNKYTVECLKLRDSDNAVWKLYCEEVVCESQLLAGMG